MSRTDILRIFAITIAMQLCLTQVSVTNSEAQGPLRPILQCLKNPNLCKTAATEVGKKTWKYGKPVAKKCVNTAIQVCQKVNKQLSKVAAASPILGRAVNGLRGGAVGGVASRMPKTAQRWLSRQARNLDVDGVGKSVPVPSVRPSPSAQAPVRVDVPTYRLFRRPKIAPPEGSYRGVTEADRAWGNGIFERHGRSPGVRADMDHWPPLSQTRPGERIYLRPEHPSINRSQGSLIRKMNKFRRKHGLYVRPTRRK